MSVRPKKDATRGLRLNMMIDLINKKTPYGGVTVKELMDKFEVSERQIHRDLNTIVNEMRVPLIKHERVIEGSKRTCYCLEVGYLPSLSPEKATVLFLSLLQQKGSALTGHLNELKDALVSTLFKYHYDPKELAVEKLQNRIHLVEETLVEPERVGEMFSKLVQALKDCHRVKIRYFVTHSQRETERVVEPYGLICKRQNWYLVGKCLTRNAIRVFRVDQIRDVFPYTSEKYQYPADFNLKEYMAHSWGVINDGEVCRVRLKFNHRVAHRVKNLIYHPSQVLEEELPDGSIIVSFMVCGIKEMKTWIVQWGDTVEVLEPGWLREDMCKLAEGILQVYRDAN
ncbi:transcriptional regulator-like protein [Desulfotomaculum nigrificans CO-1-SRB]|uniref:Transcriptional regulator-like protein n=1 Tax=Desulfotomaculum nigrificans (strain DSM 14880 / VKM B-2319 / CO-1-SRB) TaxID=868595 RepID=F6B8H0_DESCC|nr:WYL domain-containing protein [Desulfotomaculum nigrificans]AEF93542.1 transcriptional regulator-like protein [Desulfotomaculum nigrificans CO-1-SRB]